MIYKFQPFSITRELGKEYNAHCNMVPGEQDWILMLDYDCMVLHFSAYQQMQQAIVRYPEAEIFTAYTNRVGYRAQRLKGKMSKDNVLTNHMQLAAAQTLEFPNGLAVPVTTAAGFFLLFKKSYWLQNPFQETIIGPNGKYFDYNFCKPAQKRGTIMLIKGIYVWHTYRILNKSYRNDSHLWA